MEAIVLSVDVLKALEKRFGACVRNMGPWISDGTFGYCAVPITVVEQAAESVEVPDLVFVLERLRNAPEQSEIFISLLESFGRTLIDRIVALYDQQFFEPSSETLLRRSRQSRKQE